MIVQKTTKQKSWKFCAKYQLYSPSDQLEWKEWSSPPKVICLFWEIFASCIFHSICISTG